MPSFAAGHTRCWRAISPALHKPRRPSALGLGTEAVPHHHTATGGAKNRAGTKFVGYGRGHDDPVHLDPVPS